MWSQKKCIYVYWTYRYQPPCVERSRSQCHSPKTQIENQKHAFAPSLSYQLNILCFGAHYLLKIVYIACTTAHCYVHPHTDTNTHTHTHSAYVRTHHMYIRTHRTHDSADPSCTVTLRNVPGGFWGDDGTIVTMRREGASFSCEVIFTEEGVLRLVATDDAIQAGILKVSASHQGHTKFCSHSFIVPSDCLQTFW